MCTDPAQNIITAAAGSTVDYLDDLDRDLRELRKTITLGGNTKIILYSY